MVYVLNKNNVPLMPCSSRKARILLKEQKAKVVQRTPFTIKLLYGSSGHKQEIILGVDAGSKTIGISATTKTKELYSAEVKLRNDIVDLISDRRQFRRARRNNKTRYRRCKWKFAIRLAQKEKALRKNAKKDKKSKDKKEELKIHKFIKTSKKDWLAPSIQHKVNSHLTIVSKIHKILPISKIIVETASFDIQKIKNPDIENLGYQKGEQFNFWNVREYVLFRDGHKCKGKDKCGCKILNVHHIESRKTGDDAPNNLITLCEECHNNYHNGTLKLNLKRGRSFKDATFMGVMRWFFYNKLKEKYPNVKNTYGYITKNTRIENKLPKTHNVDAYCITGNIEAKRLDFS